jgi:hypothetical protein
LEGLTGQTVRIGTFVGRYLFRVGVYGAFIPMQSGSQGNALANAIVINDLQQSGIVLRPRQ